MTAENYGEMPTPPKGRGTGNRPDPLAGLAIIVDTREQTPLVFPDGVKVERGTLHTGDYSIKGFEDRFTVERKSAQDLVGTLTRGRERFTRELERMGAFEFRRIIVERPYADIAAGRFGFISMANPKAIIGTIHAFEVRYKVSFVFAANRGEAARRVLGWCRAFAREQAKIDEERKKRQAAILATPPPSPYEVD